MIKIFFNHFFMSKIIKLDKNLANQISAWEVVERPLSVVKELVENSIDALATNIKIELFSWWIQKIIVSDNWFWIEKSDLKLVVEKYTTSKIKSLKDLHNVLTFWFRWEAMASISSVSNMEIISKSKNEDFWNKIKIIWWEKWQTEKTPFEIWTKIIVENLFYNTPARLNYLKKERTEYNHIYKYLQEISLSYPEIWFEFLNEWKEIFKYRQNETLKTRIYNIFSEEFLNNLLELNFEMIWMKLSWFISDPKVSFTNKNRQILFVNNRPIKSPLIIKAINDAYNRFIPHSNFPAYILNLEIDPTQIDVNVHPRKLEIRFAEEKSIFRIFYHSIEEKLNSVSLIKPEKTEILSTWTYTKNSFSDNKEEKTPKYYTWSGTKFKSYSPYKDISTNPNQIKISDSINFTKEILNNNEYNENISNEIIVDNFETNTDLHFTKLWKIIWQFHNSYIVVETKNWIQILDQHALAERIIYEKLVKTEKKYSSQWLLISENLNLTPLEINILKENKDTFEKMWFDFEILAKNNLIINSIPDFIKKENLKNIFLGILNDLQNNSKSKTLEEVKNKIFAYTACRSAIKFWNKLSLFEINKLLNDSVTEYSSTCPHGRPVVYEINLEELKGKYER